MARELTPDWILQETLAVQKQALQQYLESKMDNTSLTLTVLGCGTLCTAILGGILDSVKVSDTSSDGSLPKRLPNKFNACVRSAKSAARITEELGKYEANLKVLQNDNVKAVQEADVILLGCKPYMVKDVLKAEGIKDALKNKLLISVLAGVPETQIETVLYDGAAPEDACRIVRAMPNTAAAIRESMTVVGITEKPLPEETKKLVTWMFSQIGRVTYLPAANMDVCTALCGSGPAFGAVIIEALAAGAIAMGMPRDDAYTMAAQVMRGSAGLVLAGEHPAIVRDKITTPGGCTIGGLLVLDDAGVRGTIAKAVREATVVASQLGQGKQGVNGTRW